MIKCSACDENSIYYNALENKEYCKKHFCQYFETSIKNNLKELKIANPRIAIYYSGGKDSAVLLYVLKKILKFNVVAITANLGIKEHFNKIVGLGRKICNELDIEYYEASLKDVLNTNIEEIVKKNNPRLACHYCGEIRNIALDRVANRLKVDYVASGHNRDDVARFLHNNYLKNDIFRMVEFSSKIYPSESIKDKIKYENPIQLKPMIYLSEKEITLYCLINHIEITDACCGFGERNKSEMQNWRSDLTYAINFLEGNYPGYSIKLINNFERNLIPLFDRCTDINKELYKTRNCVFCKNIMNTEIKDVCWMCNECSDKIGLKVNTDFQPIKLS